MQIAPFTKYKGNRMFHRKYVLIPSSIRNLVGSSVSSIKQNAQVGVVHYTFQENKLLCVHLNLTEAFLAFYCDLN